MEPLDSMKGYRTFIMENGRFRRLREWLPVCILLLYPLRRAGIGIDLMDAGYSLGNYRYFEVMNPTWRLATYLANVAGVVLSALPFGDTWLGMNVYTSLLIGITCVIAYCFLRKRLGHPLLLFLGEMLALSLCWAPSVVLYHYLGYFAMTAAALLLYRALTDKNNICYIIAGGVLGMAVCVRMPNITYVALIVPVWYYAWLERDKRRLVHTLYCIGGFAAGLLVPMAVIGIRYGLNAYPDMVASLFGMTDKATDYKPTAMIYAMFSDYLQYSAWLLLFALCMGAGLVLFRIAKGRFIIIKKLLYLAGLLLLLRFCYGRGMFDFVYTAYFSMYKWVTVYLLLVNLLCAYNIFKRDNAKERRLWSAFLLVIIWITPLGSNNGLYPVINNLFLIAPVSLVFIYEELRGLDAWQYRFPVWAMTGFIVGFTLLQSYLFGIFFTFHDVIASGERYVTVDIAGSSSTRGMRTTVDKKAQLETLGGYLTENELTDKKVLLYGDIPAISYIFDMEPAVYTTWADLASNPLERLREDLAAITQDYPVVIVSKQTGDLLEKGRPFEDAKLQCIFDFLEKGGYTCTYSQDGFCVYLAN